MEEKPTVIPLPAIPVTPTVTLEAPVTTTIHALDLRPLTNTVPVTQMIPITPHFVTGCNAKVALSKLPSSSDTIVLAGLAQTISSTKELKYLAADVPLILYRVAEHGAPVSSEMCPQAPTWLWQQMFYVSSTITTTVPLLMSLPASRVCAIPDAPGGYDLKTFERKLTEKNEWPDLLYLKNDNGQRSVVFVVPPPPGASCTSGSGCEAWRQACQSIFSDGMWQQVCYSMCG